MKEFLVNEDKKEKSDFYTIVGKCWSVFICKPCSYETVIMEYCMDANFCVVKIFMDFVMSSYPWNITVSVSTIVCNSRDR